MEKLAPVMQFQNMDLCHEVVCVSILRVFVIIFAKKHVQRGKHVFLIVIIRRRELERDEAIWTIAGLLIAIPIIFHDLYPYLGFEISQSTFDSVTYSQFLVPLFLAISLSYLVKKFVFTLSEYERLSEGLTFPKKLRMRYPFWLHDSHLLDVAKGEERVPPRSPRVCVRAHSHGGIARAAKDKLESAQKLQGE